MELLETGNLRNSLLELNNGENLEMNNVNRKMKKLAAAHQIESIWGYPFIFKHGLGLTQNTD